MLLRPILQKKKKNPIDAVMVQQAKYYSKRINFTETNAWEMIEESKRVLQITIAYYLSQMSPWLTVQCNGDLPKHTKNVTCCRPSHSAQRFQLFNQEKNKWKGYKDLHLLAKPGWELTPAPITDSRHRLHYSVRFLKAGIAPILFTNMSPRPK